jgi:OFA family oxalate/formate antiporter-like MFS transporter
MTARYRYYALAASLLVQVCLGAIYAWSVFVGPLRLAAGLTQTTAQLPFSFFYFCFPFTMFFAGRLLHLFGPRACAMTGGGVFGAGWIFASLGGYSYAWTVAGIGVLGGIGVGIVYVVPIAVLVRWFPASRGAVTGLAVAGFGGGALLISQVAGALTGAGMSPFEVFRLLGITFLIVSVPAGWLMVYPSGSAGTVEEPLPVRTVLRRTEFIVLYLCMVMGLAAGFAVNANLRDLSVHGASQAGLIAVGVFAVANATGRPLWGFVFDRMHPRTVLLMNLVGQAALLLTAGLWLRGDAGYLSFAALAGIHYGGVLVLYAAMVVRIWGSAQVGQVYGWLFSANMIAAPAATLSGAWFDAGGSFLAPLAIIGVCILFAALVLWRTASLRVV